VIEVCGQKQEPDFMRHFFLLILLEASSLTFLVPGKSSAGPANAQKSEPHTQVILEVINRHFTVGRKIPSVYLNVFSDGTAECHTVKYSGEEMNTIKKKTLRMNEFDELRRLIEESEWQGVRNRYELMHTVVDSWMEWDIRIKDSRHARRIQVADFSPRSAREKHQPYPDVLVRLGCFIWKFRDEVYGDEPAYRNDDCKRALGIESSFNQ
jgi:hypothetical protein